MTNSEPDKNSDTTRRIVLTEKEISEITLLYETALQFSQSPSHSHNGPDIQNQTKNITSYHDHDSNDSMLKRKKAWHDVQEYLEKLGRKYDYDPEKFVINKITRELEPYKPPS